MKWTSKHQALLSSLRAGQIIPSLYARLSSEHYTASEQDLRRLAAWPSALREEPSWAFIEPVLDKPEMWPQVWERATKMGWSPVCAHHHALLFTHLTQKLVQDEEFELASWCWEQVVESWKQVFLSTYPHTMLADLSTVPDTSTYHDTLNKLLEPLVHELTTHVHQGLGLDAKDALNSMPSSSALARWAWRALKSMQGQWSNVSPDAFGALTRASASSSVSQASLTKDIIERFEQAVDALVLADVEEQALLAPFEWMVTVHELLRLDSDARVALVRRTVSTAWSLRKLDRDDEPMFTALFERGRAINDVLADDLLTHKVIGNNSKCSDFIVFLGEQEYTSEDRRALFEHAQKVCPGHRNSALLLSYECIRQAKALATNLTSVSAMLVRRTGPSKDVQQTIDRMVAELDTAYEVYGLNEKLPETAAIVVQAIERLGIEAPERFILTQDNGET